MRCQGQQIPSMKPCEKQAVTTRKNWRWGDAKKGEPLTVPVTLHFCKDCAAGYDDNRAEAEAEAAGS